MGHSCADAGIISEQDTLRQSLHELIIDPLLASAMPSQVGLCLCSALALGNSAALKMLCCMPFACKDE